ncbi:hypothetical protein BJY00DRAFT_285485 [Aspergillus carlsbadensis]|nr:hypothetical protein BJY00DRAFT_285485 [Aspergillus carlsbadensis]
MLRYVTLCYVMLCYFASRVLYPVYCCPSWLKSLTDHHAVLPYLFPVPCLLSYTSSCFLFCLRL